MFSRNSRREVRSGFPLPIRLVPPYASSSQLMEKFGRSPVGYLKLGLDRPSHTRLYCFHQSVTLFSSHRRFPASNATNYAQISVISDHIRPAAGLRRGLRLGIPRHKADHHSSGNHRATESMKAHPNIRRHLYKKPPQPADF